MKRLGILLLTIFLLAEPAYSRRIKDIVNVQGIRGNPLRGIGLVIGLADTGDSSLPSKRMLTNIFRDAGLVLSPDDFDGKNVAVVMVTALLGPFHREGSRIDVDVSAMGDAESLQGGMLLPTPLEGLDGQVYAIAQGSLSLGGWGATGENASITKNHQTVGRIPAGAIVEKAEVAKFIQSIAGRKFVTLNLRNPDFSTAKHIAEAIDDLYKQSSTVIDAGTINVIIPEKIKNTDIADFIDKITAQDVQVDTPAVVVVNERTGTIVVGQNVGISEVAIAQGSLVVKIKETANVSQPVAPFSDAGSTEVIPETILGVQEQQAHLIRLPESVTVSELAKSLNAVGASPRDLIAIFNALKKAGALQAKLEIM